MRATTRCGWVAAAVATALAAAADDSAPAHGAAADDGFEAIFDGSSLAGWRAQPQSDADAWTVRDGVIRGEGKGDRLAYLIYAGDEQLGDFELRFDYRMVTDGNSGVEVRARDDASGKRPFEGYHADFGHLGIGAGVLGAWDFHFGASGRKEFPCPRGTRLAIAADGESARSEAIDGAAGERDIVARGWNSCRVVARGRTLEFYINGKLSSAFTDNAREGYLDKGLIALQLHDKGMVVEFRKLALKKLGG